MLSYHYGPRSHQIVKFSVIMAELLASNVVQPTINTKCAAYCPAMDLIALATVDGQIHVFRLNGQEVFEVANKQSPGKVNGIQWKPNGKIVDCVDS